ncbi:putative peptidase Do [Paenibacillus algicola]|uniref:Putative peptidase Do n=2 Tax=Paenibacillus algicola TaxID=2565926 RepID=A0A4P8XPU0_9BACL|nr:trypsin-like peptidase domain-containing protein [Paenibacillus algicola]QCT04513.1 putative peptidase Do [Paenibacillus algicola]
MHLWKKTTAALVAAGIMLLSSVLHPGMAAAATKNNSAYTYPQDSVPQVIQGMSPSVVGIAGKLTGGMYTEDRYNLSHGSGVILSKDGWIVTNAHVVDRLSTIQVVTSDGKTYQARSVFSDDVSDIAVVKINAKGLKPAVFAVTSQNAQVGEKVAAIGTPISFSLRNSATVGVVSGLNRSIDSSYRLIQTDTAINPGNSGGPLVNMKGEVIGINSMKFSAIGVENMGFSIPSETVGYVVKQLIQYGEVKRAGLGLSLEESFSAIVGFPSEDPLQVTDVTSLEAIQAGISKGDVLYAINGKRVYSIVDINEMLKLYAPGTKVKLLMQRDGDIVSVPLVLSSGINEPVEDAEWEEEVEV